MKSQRVRLKDQPFFNSKLQAKMLRNCLRCTFLQENFWRQKFQIERLKFYWPSTFNSFELCICGNESPRKKIHEVMDFKIEKGREKTLSSFASVTEVAENINPLPLSLSLVCNILKSF